MKEPDGTYLVQGHVGLEDLSDMLSDVFESEDAESIGGLALSISGDFPDMGEKVHYGHWTIEVIEVRIIGSSFFASFGTRTRRNNVRAESNWEAVAFFPSLP